MTDQLENNVILHRDHSSVVVLNRSSIELLRLVMTSFIPQVRTSVCDVRRDSTSDLISLKEMIESSCLEVSLKLNE